MAASVASFHGTNVLSFFFLFSVVTSNENTTSFSFNTTAFVDGNLTNEAAENYTTTQPEEFESPTSTPTPGSTEEPPEPPEPLEPPEPPEPLPVSGLGRLCPCDEHMEVCDISCCCDRDCSEEVALFTSCSVETVGKLMHEIFLVPPFSFLGVDGFSHPSPALPTDRNFDSLFKTFTSFVFDSEEDRGEPSAAELQDSSGYQVSLKTE
uniref:Tectonic-1-3 N-terminal domain-containing protein n=1 Tax=Labrus bergylta TaxID=56723 RepID=A0A3Q3N690_9LABR